LPLTHAPVAADLALVCIATATDAQQALWIRHLLERAGIRFTVWGEQTSTLFGSSYNAAAGAITFQVQREAEVAALAAIADAFNLMPAVEACPACGAAAAQPALTCPDCGLHLG
jgi:hypothetical protein